MDDNDVCTLDDRVRPLAEPVDVALSDDCRLCGGSLTLHTSHPQGCGECDYHAYDGDEATRDDCGAVHRIAADGEDAYVREPEGVE